MYLNANSNIIKTHFFHDMKYDLKRPFYIIERFRDFPFRLIYNLDSRSYGQFSFGSITFYIYLISYHILFVYNLN